MRRSLQVPSSPKTRLCSACSASRTSLSRRTGRLGVKTPTDTQPNPTRRFLHVVCAEVLVLLYSIIVLVLVFRNQVLLTAECGTPIARWYPQYLSPFDLCSGIDDRDRLRVVVLFALFVPPPCVLFYGFYTASSCLRLVLIGERFFP